MCGYSAGLSGFSSPRHKGKGVGGQEGGRRNVSVPAAHAGPPPTSPGWVELGSGKREVGGHCPRLLCLPPLEQSVTGAEASESAFPRGQQRAPSLFSWVDLVQVRVCLNDPPHGGGDKGLTRYLVLLEALPDGPTPENRCALLIFHSGSSQRACAVNHIVRILQTGKQATPTV